MKRFLAVLCALVLAMSCFSVVNAEAAEPVELKVLMLGPADQKDTEVVWEAFNEKLHETLPNITVDFFVPADYATTYNMAMASGERWDLSWTGWYQNLAQEAEKGNLLPMDDLIEQYAPDLSTYYTKELLDMHRVYDGKLYQIPSNGNLCMCTAKIFPMEILDTMREDWLTDLDAAYKANLASLDFEAKFESHKKTIALYEEYFEAAEKLGKLGVGAEWYVLPTIYGVDGYIVSVYESAGFIGITNDLKVVNPYEAGSEWDEAHRFFLSKTAEWYKKGWIPKDVISLSGSGALATKWDGALGDNNAIVYNSNYYDSLEDCAQSNAIARKSDVAAVKYSAGFTMTLGNSTGWSIPYTSEYPAEAMTFLNETFVVPELYEIFVYGLKDVHYTENEDGSIVTLGGSGQATADWAYGQFNWTLGNQMFKRMTQAETIDPVITSKKNAENQKYAYITPLLTWNFDKTNIENEWSNVNVILNEYRNQFLFGVLGDEWEATYDSMVAELEAAGIDKIIEEAQKQLDEYAAAKGITTLGTETFTNMPEQAPAIARYTAE